MLSHSNQGLNINLSQDNLANLTVRFGDKPYSSIPFNRSQNI